jgi:regulation of enolase protein 1 (concanavalin A-like superfamily)
VVAEVVGSSSDNLSYQWQRDGLDVPGATAANYTTPPVTQADSGKKYRVKISLPGGTTTLSQEATLTVSQDLTPPQIVSAASLDGNLVGVCFNEALDAASASVATNYALSGGAVVNNATLQADGATVALAVSGLTGNSFTVTVSGVKDLAGNAANSSAAGQVLELTPQDLGTVEAPGFAISCAPGSADVWARGRDIFGTADSGHFVYEQRTGDFDVRVQVQSFQAPAPDANAGLMVRESIEAGSRNISIVVYANQRNWTSALRAQVDGATTVFPGNWRIDWPAPANYPSIWVRLKRAANTFTTYGGTNGVDWIQIGDAVTPGTPYAATALVGLRTTPVEVEMPGTTAVVQYRHYGDFVEILAPSLAVAVAGVNQIALSWPANGTQDFVLESISVLGAANWRPVTNAPTGQGNVKTVTLPVETSGGRFFRLRR